MKEGPATDIEAGKATPECKRRIKVKAHLRRDVRHTRQGNGNG